MADTLSVLTPVLSKTRVGHRPGNDLRDSLEEAKITVIGSGAFGAVFEDDNQVFKIYDQHEVGYGRYVEFMSTIQSPILPKIEKIGNIGRWQLISIERLYPIYQAFPNHDRMLMSTYLNNVVNRIMQSRGEEVPVWWNDDGSYIPPWDDLILDVDNLKLIVDKMIDFANSYTTDRIYWDLHCGNFMFRKVGDKFEFVLTDPWSS